ncbi:MAG: DUF72 domain-containing protein [Planctomycetota bacterium]|jgi:uncharacterized protein YecE (DUF72 family)
MADAEKLYIGTAGWSYPDWQGIVYPPSVKKGPSQLGWLSNFVNCVEINNTFYRPPVVKHIKSWLDAVRGADDFTFTVKLWRGFTHESGWTQKDVKEFRDGIAPLREEGRLGAVLVQYAWSFENTGDSRAALHKLSEAFSGESLVLEVRHASWNTDAALDFIRDNGFSFANIDQPEASKSITGTSHLTGPIGYIRLHGRNREAWFDRDSGRDEKYNYLYSRAELEWWVERVQKVRKDAKTTYIILNNHFKGKSLANALQIAALLGKKVTIPEQLRTEYPALD